ncbi:NUDIX hydrolase domain-like protein [Morchella snyderi]|nr:NUDIX hydrolase domain-like protein [Morchella snyderi]
MPVKVGCSMIDSRANLRELSPLDIKPTETLDTTALHPISQPPNLAMSAKRYSNLDLVNSVDSFPSAALHPSLHAERLSTLAIFTHGTHPLGYLLPPVVAALSDPALSGPHWTITGATVTLAGATPAERSANMLRTLTSWRAADTFAVLRGWRSEEYAVYSPRGALFLTMERSACALFGVVTYGVHMTAYVRPLSPGGALRLWVPTRNPAKPTYGGMLDNTVAGGIAAGMGVLETLVKEGGEEASFAEELVRRGARSVGAVSYFYERHRSAGGEEGLLQPEVQFVWDMEVGEEVVPRPGDDEVVGFRLLGVEEVKEELAKGSFKPNCAIVLLDFFIRHGILTPENEPDYIEICSRIHRRFEFPTW